MVAEAIDFIGEIFLSLGLLLLSSVFSIAGQGNFFAAFTTL